MYTYTCTYSTCTQNSYVHPYVCVSRSGAWIITGGTHAGVMRYVGEAVREFTDAHGLKTNIVALGIAPWGVINNKESLIDEEV